MNTEFAALISAAEQGDARRIAQWAEAAEANRQLSAAEARKVRALAGVLHTALPMSKAYAAAQADLLDLLS